MKVDQVLSLLIYRDLCPKEASSVPAKLSTILAFLALAEDFSLDADYRVCDALSALFG